MFYKDALIPAADFQYLKADHKLLFETTIQAFLAKKAGLEGKVELDCHSKEGKGIRTSATRKEMGRCMDYNGKWSDGGNYGMTDPRSARNFIDSEFEECLKNIANYIMADKYSVNKLHYIAYLFEQYQSAGIIGDFDVSSFYKKIEVSMNNRKDTALNRDYYFDSTMLKNSSNFFTDLNSQVEKLSKNELLKIHSDTMPKYLEEFFDTGEFEKQKFIEFLNAATESQIIMFCQYVLGSPKHIDTYCYNLSDHIDSFYMHNWGNRQNIEFVKKYLTENIKDTRIPKLRIEPLLAKIQ